MNYLMTYKMGALGDTLGLLPFFEDFHNQHPDDNLYFRWMTADHLWFKQRDIVFAHTKHIVPYNGEFINRELVVTAEADVYTIPIISIPYKVFNDAGIKVEQTVFRVPWNFLPGELESFSYKGDKPLALVNCGYHPIVSSKSWGIQNYQELVNQLKDKINFIQVGETVIGGYQHPVLDGTFMNLLNKTSVSTLAVLIYYADFVFTNVTSTNLFATIPSHKTRHVFCFAGNREQKELFPIKADDINYHFMQSNKDYSSCFNDNRPACWLKDAKNCKCVKTLSNGEQIAGCMFDIKCQYIVDKVNEILGDNHGK